MKLDRHQKIFIAEKLMDSANYALAGLVLGQLITREFQLVLALLGVLIYLFGWAVSLRLQKGVSDQ